MNFKISVVMASYLGDYEFAAKDRVRKFHRAVNSFLNQTYTNAELLIVSDGCDKTINEVMNNFNLPNIKLIPIEKQSLFSGTVRDIGCKAATGDIICFLDADDFWGKRHLENINLGFTYHIFNNIDWVYFDDHIIYRFNPTNKEILSKATRNVTLEQGVIGTSSIAYKKSMNIDWLGCDHYGHDWTFIKKLIDSKKQYTKIDGGEYYVCHVPNSVDC